MKKIILLAFLISSLGSVAQSKAPSHEIWNTLLKKNVSNNGKVNYKGFISDSAQLGKYLILLSGNKPDEKTWSANDRKVFWINAYNAFTVKLIIKNYPLKSINEVVNKMAKPAANSPWDIKFIKIGNDTYDLNGIENEKLRKQFGDARIHFALVCASKSCPVLLNEAYTSEKLDHQLNDQAKTFLMDKTRNDISSNQPKLSKIFDWYAADFKSKEFDLIGFINNYSSIKISSSAKISYLDYSWSLNE